jgi:cytochrome P450
MLSTDYNAAIFPDPEAFKPSRWYETDTEILSSDSKSTPRETTTPEASFTSFYLGPRVCIGKKFAMVEATCFLTLLLRDFKLSIGGRREGEGREEWRRRVMQGRTDFTFHPTSIPVVLERRA